MEEIMKEKDAINLVQNFLETHGLQGNDIDADPTAIENSEEGKGEDSFAGGDPDIAFRFLSDKGELKCYALIYEFADPPKPGVLETCEEEAKKSTTDMGGGALEYDNKDQG